MLNFLKTILLTILFLMPSGAALASDTNVYLFHGDGCPHCTAERSFIEKLKKDNNIDFNLREYEIYYNKENQELIEKITKNMDWTLTGVPFTIIADKSYTGYGSDATTGTQLENAIRYCNQNDCPDPVSKIIANEYQSKKETKKETKKKTTKESNPLPTVSLPLFGELNTKTLSLPLITIIIAAIDGFNPCAMWILIFLIGLLLRTENKKRRWILGGTFIATSGIVYFLFLAAWLNAILFLGFVPWLRTTIGIVAIVSAYLSLKAYHEHKTGVCKVTNSEKRKLVFENLKKFVLEKNYPLALGGIILLAAIVNLVELFCSAGLPATFTQILALSDLPATEYYAYMTLYVIIFMLDDMLIFAIAMKTMEIKSVSDKFNRYSTLIGGIVMLILGILLIFFPEALMFG